jgi:very-short-patch-repair endonuclease
MTNKINWKTAAWLTEHYVNKNLSTWQIARDVGTHPNTVRRALKSFGIKLRERSDAQVNYLAAHDHPATGTTRSQEAKERITSGIKAHWDRMSEDEKRERCEEIAQRSKRTWQSKTDEEKDLAVRKMTSGNRKAQGRGSKNENMVARLLAARGYKLAQRTTEYTPGGAFEIDIAIPSEAIAIEWDGPAHFSPIYGEDDLARVQDKDERKNATLLSNNWTVLRVRDHSTSHSKIFCERAVDAIEEVMKNGDRHKVHYINAR